MSKKNYLVRLFCCALLCLASVGAFVSPNLRAALTLPDQVIVGLGDRELSSAGIDESSISVRASGDERLADAQADRDGGTATISVMGIPVRTVSLVNAPQRVIPGGMAAGVKLYTRGVLVVGTSPVTLSDGSAHSPAQEAGLRAGDFVLEVDGIAVTSSDHLSELVSRSVGSVRLTIDRAGKQSVVQAEPVTDASDGQKRLGLWTRDST